MHVKKRICVFVDGSNTYHLLRRVVPKGTRLQGFDYRNLICLALQEQQTMDYFYYIGLVRPVPGDPISQKLFYAQQKLFSHLGSAEQKFSIHTAQLILSGSHFQEKGVDVLLAIDIVIKAVRDEYDIAVLLSSDADFAPALAFARSQGKEAVYLGFEHARSSSLTKQATRTIILRPDMISQCLA